MPALHHYRRQEDCAHQPHKPPPPEEEKSFDLPPRPPHQAKRFQLRVLASRPRQNWPVANSLLGKLPTGRQRYFAERYIVHEIMGLLGVEIPEPVLTQVGNLYLTYLANIQSKLNLSANRISLERTIDWVNDYQHGRLRSQVWPTLQPLPDHERVLELLEQRAEDELDDWRLGQQTFGQVYPQSNDVLCQLLRFMAICELDRRIRGIAVPSPVHGDICQSYLSNLKILRYFEYRHDHPDKTEIINQFYRLENWVKRYSNHALNLMAETSA